jgi:hypothetical protein
MTPRSGWLKQPKKGVYEWGGVVMLNSWNWGSSPCNSPCLCPVPLPNSGRKSLEPSCHLLKQPKPRYAVEIFPWANPKLWVSKWDCRILQWNQKRGQSDREYWELYSTRRKQGTILSQVNDKYNIERIESRSGVGGISSLNGYCVTSVLHVSTTMHAGGSLLPSDADIVTQLWQMCSPHLRENC